jgi:preprotein translocase subunit YajC
LPVVLRAVETKAGQVCAKLKGGGSRCMGDFVERLMLLAADVPKAGAPAAENGPSQFLGILPPVILVGIAFYFLVVRPQKRERERQDSLNKGLKKNDRVVTIGGIVGTIVNIEPESDVVTLRVDDNTRMVFLRSAIQRPYATAKEEPSLKENKT